MQITSFYVFTISPKYQYSALVKMAYAAVLFRRAEGCSFAKIMGSGSGDFGLSRTPNFKVYAAILVWENEQAMQHFEKTNRTFLKYQKISDSIKKFYGQAYQVHGKWGGIEPFKAQKEAAIEDSKIIVLTRAKIRLSQMRNFWRSVPKTSEALTDVKGKLFSIGVGELPLLFQATISIWESQAHMREYAYKNPHHLDAIKKTKELNWYSEELFARFVLVGQ